MDIKTAMELEGGHRVAEQEEEAPPPAYTASVSASTGHEKTVEKADDQPPYNNDMNHSAEIRAQLRALTTTLSTVRAQDAQLHRARETAVLASIRRAVDVFVLEFTQAGQPRGSLIMVPNRAVPPTAVPVYTDYEDVRVYRELRRLDCADLDERLARDLAAAMTPVPDELPQRAAEGARAGQEKDRGASGLTKKKGSSWWRKSSGYVSEPASRVEPVASSEERVVLDIKADEVVFRSENGFGILETSRGWGIVLNIVVQPAST
ncbi:hypothetical protein PVAG01_07950 [Phlyctema vagabunda]|uniref:Uncharacterized protein n=1 Tax=Phlyctema vagabunda TaxID=108571 RepID=A0ABR4PDV9_9HELO